jgi:hypothetical protein
MKRFIIAAALVLGAGLIYGAEPDLVKRDSRPVPAWEEATDALDEVNAARTALGLRPFLRDDALALGARNVAAFRARHGIEGHTENDFAGLPDGCRAAASGCAAWEPRLGWGACATYEQWTYAGAGWSLGRDGRRYMQLFVR